MINLNEIEQERTIRVFISSTFRDFQVEREILIKKVFPRIKKICLDRDVDFMEIDLRWGVTEEQVQNGSVIDVCLSAIDRCQPYFIGLVGNRYGWIPTEEEISKFKWIESKYPVLKDLFKHSPSITDIEIQFGVLKSKRTDTVAFFYFRDESTTPAEFREDESSIEYTKLQKLKSEITQGNKYPVCRYCTPGEFENQVEKDLGEFIINKFPVVPPSNLLQKTEKEHAALARSRMKVYIRDQYLLDGINDKVQKFPVIVVTGEKGCGKTALIANWIAQYQQTFKDSFILYHFIGGTSSSTNVYSLIKRICEEIRMHFKVPDDIPTTNEQLLARFSWWLNKPDRDKQWILVLDALDQLDTPGNAHELNWLPLRLPNNLTLVVSTSPGPVSRICQTRKYEFITVGVPEYQTKLDLIEKYLKLFNKELSFEFKNRIATSSLTNNILVLRTLLDELRVFGYYELLDQQISFYLQADSPMSFFQKVIGRLEKDFEHGTNNCVQKCLIYLCISNNGLSEQELLELTGVTVLEWIPFWEAIKNLLVEHEGLHNITHGFIKDAIREKFLINATITDSARRNLLFYFQKKKASLRTFSEIPFHLKILKEWKLLKDYLTSYSFLKSVDFDLVRFDLLNYWQSIEAYYDVEAEYAKRLHVFKQELKTPDFNELFSDSFQKAREQSIVYAVIGVQVAKLLMASGRYTLATSLLKESYDIFMIFPATSHEHYSLVFYTINILVAIYMKQKLYYKAEPLLIHAINDLKKENGETDLLAGVLTGTLGYLYTELELYEKSETCLKKSLEIIAINTGKKSIEAATCYNNLAILYNATGRIRLAEVNFLKAIELRKLFYGREHPETLTCLMNLSFFHLKQGKTSKAMELADEVILASGRIPGYEAPDTARANLVLGICRINRDNLDLAEKHITLALQINERLFGTLNPNTAECIQWLAICKIRRNDILSAREKYSKALEIFRATLGPEHPATIYVKEQVDSLQYYL